jgi:hypothetical protein
VLARETGCIERQRKFSGADLIQTLVCGWLTHPDASLETLASTAAIRDVYVSDTAGHKRFDESCVRFLHAMVEEVVSVLVYAEQPVPLEWLHRFSSVVLEDSSSIALPKELAGYWQGNAGDSGGGEAAIKLPVRLRSHRRSALWSRPDRWAGVRSASSLAPGVPARQELV